MDKNCKNCLYYVHKDGDKKERYVCARSLHFKLHVTEKETNCMRYTMVEDIQTREKELKEYNQLVGFKEEPAKKQRIISAIANILEILVIMYLILFIIIYWCYHDNTTLIEMIKIVAKKISFWYLVILNICRLGGWYGRKQIR